MWGHPSRPCSHVSRTSPVGLPAPACGFPRSLTLHNQHFVTRLLRLGPKGPPSDSLPVGVPRRGHRRRRVHGNTSALTGGPSARDVDQVQALAPLAPRAAARPVRPFTRNGRGERAVRCGVLGPVCVPARFSGTDRVERLAVDVRRPQGPDGGLRPFLQTLPPSRPSISDGRGAVTVAHGG